MVIIVSECELSVLENGVSVLLMTGLEVTVVTIKTADYLCHVYGNPLIYHCIILQISNMLEDGHGNKQKRVISIIGYIFINVWHLYCTYS